MAENPNVRRDDDGNAVAVKVFGKGGRPVWVNPGVARDYDLWDDAEADRRRKTATGDQGSPPVRTRTVVKDDAAEVPEDALKSKEIGKRPEADGERQKTKDDAGKRSG